MTNCKSLELDRLYREYQECVDQRFPDTLPHEFVWGFGSPDSPVMLVGEAPGKDEVLQGRPFVGKAGKMLTAFLEGAGLNREDLFISNTMKYRLSKEGARSGTLVNRPARREEILFSSEYLRREAEIIHPKAVVTLGNVPLKAVTYVSAAAGCRCSHKNAAGGCSFSDLPDIGTVHGMPIENAFGIEGISLFPLYHPASVIYNRALESAYKNDLKKFFAFFSIFFEKRC